MSEPNTTEISVIIKRETEKAYLLQEKGETHDESWFPKSEVHFSYRNGDEATAVIPDWLLEQKGW